MTCAFIVVGDLVRSRSEPSALLSLVTIIVVLAAVLVRSERGRVEAARGHAVAEERLRIAGDMHDLVGHGLGAVAVQSSTARVALDAGDERAARAALTAVESTSRTAMREMRQLLGLLRDGSGTVSEVETPPPGLAEIATLVGNVRAGGVAVTADLPPGTGHVPPEVQLCAYRVVQEALTNAVKHAPGAIVTVRVTSAETILRVVVDSSGGTRAQREAEGSGLGLAGIRARVAAAGGQSRIGPTADGWRVDAHTSLAPNGHAMTIRVGICDDQPLLRDGLRVHLGLVGDLDIVGEAANGEQAVALARQERPDVLVMDVRMPVLDGIEATRRIVGGPGTENVKVLILTTFDLDEHVYAALSAGASGFLLKDATPDELVHAVRVVAAGEALLAPRVTSRLVREFARRPAGRPRRELLASLTQRETEVLQLVAAGLSNAELAQRLVISHATAKTHVSRILTKLGLRDRAQLVVAAYEAGLAIPGG